MIQPPFPSTIGAQRRPGTFLTTKTAVRKPGKRRSDGVPCLDKPALAQGHDVRFGNNEQDPDLMADSLSSMHCNVPLSLLFSLLFLQRKPAPHQAFA